MRLLYLITLLSALLLSVDVTAQRSYSGNTLGCEPGVPNAGSQGLNADRSLGVCNQKATHQLQFVPGSRDLGAIDFFIRSCWAWWYTNECQTGNYGRYSVEVSGDTESGYFYLTGSGGDTLKVVLAFSHPARPEETLNPDVETSTLYPGVTDYQAGPVALRVALAPGESLVSDSYSGSFDLYVDQCEWWDYQPQCKNAAGQDGAPALEGLGDGFGKAVLLGVAGVVGRSRAVPARGLDDQRVDRLFREEGSLDQGGGLEIHVAGIEQSVALCFHAHTDGSEHVAGIMEGRADGAIRIEVEGALIGAEFERALDVVELAVREEGIDVDAQLVALRLHHVDRIVKHREAKLGRRR